MTRWDSTGLISRCKKLKFPIFLAVRNSFLKILGFPISLKVLLRLPSVLPIHFFASLILFSVLFVSILFLDLEYYPNRTAQAIIRFLFIYIYVGVPHRSRSGPRLRCKSTALTHRGGRSCSSARLDVFLRGLKLFKVPMLLAARLGCPVVCRLRRQWLAGAGLPQLLG